MGTGIDAHLADLPWKRQIKNKHRRETRTVMEESTDKYEE